MSQKVDRWLGSVGYNLLINGVYWGYNPLILTFDPNFLGHPSTVDLALEVTIQSTSFDGRSNNDPQIRPKLQNLPAILGQKNGWYISQVASVLRKKSRIE